MGRHTPGPWFFGDQATSGALMVFDEEGSEIAQVLPSTAEADARLIAAAPDYFAAADEVLRISIKHMQRDMNRIPADLRDAITKLADAHTRANHGDAR